MKSNPEDKQQKIFKTRLDSFINLKHPLVKLSDAIDWEKFEHDFSNIHVSPTGRPALSTRLMVALNYLKYIFDLSDEALLESFVSNPYFQYFCGMEYFEHEFPCDSSSMTRWRKKIGESACEKMLQETLEVGARLGLYRKNLAERVIVDTTVQEKNISFPTDTKLVFRARQKLVKEARKQGIELKQSYERVGKKTFAQACRYTHAKQIKRAGKSLRKLRTQLRAVITDIERKCAEPNEKLSNLLGLAKQVEKQRRHDKDKIYSLHEPHVECICKGKSHKPYEFGNKVAITMTAKENWVVGVKSFHGRPYDGKTLKEAIKQSEGISGKAVSHIFVDKGFKGKGHHPEGKLTLLSGRKRLRPFLKKLLKRRSAIEPIIGHIKEERRMQRNFLKGIEGDKINPILAGAAQNIAKILRGILAPIFNFFFQILKTLKIRKLVNF